MASLQKLYGLQYLRAFAAMIVVVHHAQSSIPYFSDINSAWYSFEYIRIWGRIGVDIFFVISGFIMFSIVSNMQYSLSNVATFFKNRFVRVAPLYWFYTLVTLMLLLDRELLLSQDNIVYIKQFILSILFIPYFDAKNNFQHPLLMVGWTLILEMYFYSLVALCYLIFRKYWFYATSIVIIACVYFFIPNHVGLKWVISNIYLLEFAAGMAIGILFKQKLSINKTVAILLLLIGCIIALWTVYFDTSLRLFYLRAVSSFLIVLSVIYLEPYLPKLTFLSLVGDASYTLYLSHTIVFFILSILFNKWQIYFDSAFYLIFLMTVISLLLGLWLYRVIEKPLIQFFKRGNDISQV